jgi:hypothetical protein
MAVGRGAPGANVARDALREFIIRHNWLNWLRGFIFVWWLRGRGLFRTFPLAGPSSAVEINRDGNLPGCFAAQLPPSPRRYGGQAGGQDGGQVVAELLQIRDLRLVHASLRAKIPAASCHLYLSPRPYRATVNCRRPGGLGWAGRSGQSDVVSWGRLYTSATHIVKGKNGLGAGGSRA